MSEIVRVEAFVLGADYPEPVVGLRRDWDAEGSGAASFSASYPPMVRRRYPYPTQLECCLVRLESDSGHVGWGESLAGPQARSVAALVSGLGASLLIGEDARAPRWAWERLYAAMRVRGHISGSWLEAMSAIDVALWDLLGHLHDVPVFELFGGPLRREIPAYASWLPAVDATDEAEMDRVIEVARSVVDRGFRTIKVALGRSIENDVREVIALRRALGDGVVLVADAAGAYTTYQAIELSRDLARHGVAWLEMPIPIDDLAGYTVLSRRSAIPIALDHVSTRFQARELLSANAVQIMQPAVSQSGGISEAIRIAELADVFGSACAPHISLGSPLQLAATLHLSAAIPNHLTTEYWLSKEMFPFRVYIDGPLPEPVEGSFGLPSGPGLGVRVREDKVREDAVSRP